MLTLIEHWLPKNLDQEILLENIENGRTAVIFVAPFPFDPFDRQIEVSSNVLTHGKDGRFYILERLLSSLGLKVSHIESQDLSWEKVLELHEELAFHVENDKGQFPAAEDLYASLLTGVWTQIAFKGRYTFLQKKLKAIRGPTIIAGYDHENFLPWDNGRIRVKPLRIIFGDLSPRREVDNQSAIPIRYNCLHVPNTIEETITICKKWKGLKNEILCSFS